MTTQIAIPKPADLALTSFLTRSLTFAVLMVLSAQAVVPIPGTPVPLTLQVFALFAGAMAMGPVESGVGMLIYVLLGGLGFGVFANGAAMSGLGATAGYVIGMVVAAPVVSYLKIRINDALAGIIGLFMIYFAGVIFLLIDLHVSFIHAIFVGVLPFLVFDLLKVALVIKISRKIK